MTLIEQQKAARDFAARWKGKGYEKGESQSFWLSLLAEVLGVEHPTDFLYFEQQVRLDHTSFIDAYIPRTHVMIEQKSIEKDLGVPIKQSDGSLLNPFQQAKRYAAELPYSQRPRWIVTCNFREFWVYDMEQPNGEPQKILLENLEKEYYRLQFLVDEGNEHLRREMEVSVKAGELVGMIYDKLLEQYRSASVPTRGDAGTHSSASAETATEDGRVPNADILRSLNILCVRLVFCLYAEDAGLFHSKTAFHDYLAPYRPQDIRRALIDLFQVLDTPLQDRDPYLDEDLAAFPYVNGGLFGHRSASVPTRDTAELSQVGTLAPLIIPQFTEELKQLLLEKASADFDWSEISPTIFGAVFESTLNPETRRSGGMHYTSIENIHKVIDPLFMNDLRAEFEGIVARNSRSSQKNVKDGIGSQNGVKERIGTQNGVKDGSPSLLTPQQRQALAAFQDRLASLTFFDPACGSGNFLTETYLSLRRLENEVIQAMYGGANILTFDTLIKVHIGQFYGIEINDFACTVAKTALWIAENQMMQQTSAIAGKPMDFLPLKTNANIHEGNALRMDWAELFNQPRLADTFRYPDYIIGNPPFVGYAYQSKEQKEDLAAIMKGFGSNIDYVAGWYKKAAEMMQLGTQVSSPAETTSNQPQAGHLRPKPIRAALVSTNSITQGEQVAAIWKPLMEQYGLQLDFAYRTFRWDSEADIKAHVHCVIIGFSIGNSPSKLEGAGGVCQTDYRDSIGIAKGYEKRIYLSDNQVITAKNINGYLLDAPNIFIEKRTQPLCDVPPFVRGCQPTDDGNLILTIEEKDELLRKEPQAAPLIRPFMMGKDFIERKPRYCLWLVGADPSLLRRCPMVMERIERVRSFRLKSTKAATRLKADTPTLFDEIREPQSNYIALPKVSSENRRYIPMDYLPQEIIPGDKLFCMQGASLYHFGVLMSNVHMAWMRATCGRLKSDYSYSNTIVYNNFPWPGMGTHSSPSAATTATEDGCVPTTAGRMPASQAIANIAQTAQAILDARAKYPNASLADLYDELTMPPELRRAHQDNDRVVMAAYGFSPKMTESECVAELFKIYQQLSAT